MEEIIEEKENFFKGFIKIIFIFGAITSITLYFFYPFNSVNFGSNQGSTNFSLGDYAEKMQFYENMRYSSPNISYYIYDCPLQKKNEMEHAFEFIESKTILDFYPSNFREDISVVCEENNKIENGLFIAGEGGPTNITLTREFNVISHGEILLIKESRCKNPVIAIHEVLHALGFGHSKNKNNIMYNISSCGQTLSDDIPLLINEIYSVRTLPDLSVENVSATMNGKFLNANVSVRNNGLKESKEFILKIYADGKPVKDIEFEGLEIGFGTAVSVSRLFIAGLKTTELTFEIEYPYEELNKENNKLKLKN